jgi:glycosyltransferase involved in cell wall biosynthesis
MSSPYAKSHRPRLSVGNKISIIVSTRDRSPLLRSTLRCARAQTWSDKEVIVVDEGSSDDTQSVLATEFPEVKVVRHDVGSVISPLSPARSCWRRSFARRRSGAIQKP